MTDMPLTVHARPAWVGANPFARLLSGALSRQRIEVREVGLRRADFPADGILLLHWPDEFYERRRGWKGRLSALVALAQLSLAKRRGGLKLVWMAHNVRPHESRHGPPLRWRWFLSLVDGVIALSQDSLGQVRTAYPGLADRASLVITHGHYLDTALTPPALKPAPQGQVGLGMFGTIRPYKRPVELARLVKDSALDVRLDMAGSTQDAALVAELDEIAATGTRVAVRIRLLSDAEMEAAVDGADLIMLPYADILNSGALFYALSRFRPVVAPRKGSLAEVQRGIGTDWIFLFDGELDDAVLARALDWLRTTPRTSPPDLSAQDWDRIGAQAAGFLREIAAE